MRPVGRCDPGARKSDDNEPDVAPVRAHAQKKTFRATEQETPEGQQARTAYREAIQAAAPDTLIFLDETGTHIDLARLYAWAPRGQRAYATKPRNRGRALTLIGALGQEGIVATMSVEGGTDGAVFRSYVEQVLSPQLHPGQVVIMDNLKAHKVAGIRETIEATGARLQYLPPYSPELSPIELCWSKLKTFLRTRAARTREALEQALTDALTTITAQDARQWFTHCGYRTAPN